MSLDIIESRLKEYSPISKLEEINALKEISQEIALCGLARSAFFKKGAFQGGTCLRILYGLKRFSEDLDFILFKKENNFSWENYLKSIKTEFDSFGLNLEVLDRSQVEGIIKKAFLKETSFIKILKLQHSYNSSDKQVIKIKLEIDINPPENSKYETHYLDYPYPFSIICQDLPSLFASKCHSLLCRKYIKGRDWYDFLWYISKKTQINYEFLAKALFQTGPFKDKKINFNKKWLIDQLQLKINEIDWKAARLDVESFLKQEDKKQLELWNADFFTSILKKLENILE